MQSATFGCGSATAGGCGSFVGSAGALTGSKLMAGTPNFLVMAVLKTDTKKAKAPCTVPIAGQGS